jgi:transcriptional regulator with XRE-family HTH domain
MMPQNWRSPHRKRWNGHRRGAPVEPLSARIVRLRIARGYSAYELATAAGVFAGTIQRLESGTPDDKRVLSALATALGVPVCRLVCGEHSCAERACVPARSARSIAKQETKAFPSPARRDLRGCGSPPPYGAS